MFEVIRGPENESNLENILLVFLHIKFMTTAFEDQNDELRIRIVGL